MNTFLFFGLVLLFLASIPYIIFILGIKFGRKPTHIPQLQTPPNFTMIISAYNEESSIEDKIKNLIDCKIPKEVWELIFVDDRSSDDTLVKAVKYLSHSNINFTLISNKTRLGKTTSVNNAIAISKYPIIITTDCDVYFEKDAINYLLGRLESDPSIAAVCGELQPYKNKNNTTQLESSYRDYYGRMCDWESAVDSTYNFNGALIAFRKSALKSINTHSGADDANTAFEVIRGGYRAVYENCAVVYEDIPEKFSVQYKQKIRRAKQLIDTTISNVDIIKQNRPFSRIFYPLRFFMYVCAPLITFVALGLILVGLYLFNPVILLILLTLYIMFSCLLSKNIVNAFLINQFYLLAGLVKIGKDMSGWETRR